VDEHLKTLKAIPTTILSDAMNRMNCMEAGIKPIQNKVNMVGTAFTVKSMAGGNWGTHKALTMIGANEVLVVDARGHINTSVWGYLQTVAALKRNVAGIIIDGAIRDSAEIKESSLPVFCRGVTPAGPHKGWKDDINTQIQCGGVVVNPGDFIKGDDDGIVVISKNLIKEVITLANKTLEKEKTWFRKLEEGLNTFDIIGLTDD
jgi:regulator of RNase E activity RraA